MLEEQGIAAKFKHIAVDDEFIKQASVESQIKHYKMDSESIIKELTEAGN